MSEDCQFPQWRMRKCFPNDVPSTRLEFQCENIEHVRSHAGGVVRSDEVDHFVDFTSVRP
jgi:hypothetical protein